MLDFARPMRIVARAAAHLQHLAGITDRCGLLLQVSYHAIAHFSSRAKKAEAFLAIHGLEARSTTPERGCSRSVFNNGEQRVKRRVGFDKISA